MNLRITYTDGLNTELDLALGDVLARFGLKRWASGFDLNAKKRDLAFETEEKNSGNPV